MDRNLVLVTGASGFVGRHLSRELLKAGYRIRAVHTGDSPPAGQAEAIEWVRIPQIGPRSDWSHVLGNDVHDVVHLAAIAHRIAPRDQVDDANYDEVNHLGTAQLARAVAQTPSVRRIIFMSSIGAVTSLSHEIVNEQTPCQPVTAYGKSKLAAEKAVQAILRESQVDWCIFRPPLLYGPGNPGNMERLLRLLKLKVPLPLQSVRNRRSFLYVGNLVSAICVALEHPAAARNTFCVSDGEEMSTADLLRRLGRASGQSARLFPFPRLGLQLLGQIGSFVTRVTGRSIGFDAPAIEKLCGSLPVDSSLFRRTCGWKPPFTIGEGLEATVGQPASTVSQAKRHG